MPKKYLRLSSSILAVLVGFTFKVFFYHILCAFYALRLNLRLYKIPNIFLKTFDFYHGVLEKSSSFGQ